jgi:leucyl aminopeptidase
MVRILTQQPSIAPESIIYLAFADATDWLSAHLSPEDLAFVQQKVARDASFVQLYSKQQVVFVELLKTEADEAKMLELARRAAAARHDEIKDGKIVSVEIQSGLKPELTLAYTEGLALVNYQFLKYSSKRDALQHRLQDIYLSDTSLDAQAVERLKIVVEATYQTRDLVNEPLSYLSAVQFGEEFKRMGQEAGFEVTVYDMAKIQSLGMGGLLSVNQGSFDPPTFSILEYKPAHAKNSKPVVLVGKGVVYDTGGLSLKPTPNSMDYMKCDMGGAATVAGVMFAVAKAKLDVHVIGLVPATDNRPGNRAYVPGDVIKMYSGATVEMLNADAEGRMILADALHFAKQYEPELVMDFATLTGAAAAAVGPQATVLMGTADEPVKTKVRNSGFKVHERVIEFPLWDEYGDLIKSDIADMKNIGGPYAGAITAGKFLERYIDYPWLHFDIAPAAFNHAADHYKPKGGTGVGVRLIFDFLCNY